MKTKILISVLFLGLFACTNDNQSPLNQEEKSNISKEVELVLNSIMEGWINLDANKAFKEYFSTTDDFTYIGINGTLKSYDECFKEANEVFSSFKKAEFSFNEKKIYVVTKDIAIVSFNYTLTFYTPESKYTFPNCGSSFVMNKIENVWKVVHFQESVQETTFIETEIE